MALTKATNSMIDGAPFNVLDYGADNTGVADASPSIQSALDAAATSGGKVVIPAGAYKLSSSILINGDVVVEGQGVGASVLIADADLLEAVKFGNGSLFSGKAQDFTVQRAAYSGATENIGFAFYDCAGCLFSNIESRLSKYNFYMKPQDSQRVAYSTFVNIQGVGGYYNISGALTGTGYCNELAFYGGRMFTTADTDTNVYVGWNANHLRFNAVSCEGTGTQAFYFNGTTSGGCHSNTIENCRTEGTWSADDIVLGTNTQRCLVLGINLYTTVTDTGLGNSYILATNTTFHTGTNATSALIAKRTGASAGVPAFRIADLYSSSGDSYGLEIESGRDSASGYIIKAFRSSDGLVRFSVSSTGVLYSGTSLAVGQSAWNFEPLQLGNYVLWVDSTGDLRIKNGTPTSDTDGTVVGTQT